jgi:hypothetical protein
MNKAVIAARSMAVRSVFIVCSISVRGSIPVADSVIGWGIPGLVSIQGKVE